MNAQLTSIHNGLHQLLLGSLHEWTQTLAHTNASDAHWHSQIAQRVQALATAHVALSPLVAAMHHLDNVPVAGHVSSHSAVNDTYGSASHG